MDVERLTLVDEGSLALQNEVSAIARGREEQTHSVGRQVDDGLLRNLPDGLVDRLELGRDARDCKRRQLPSEEDTQSEETAHHSESIHCAR